jgi:hypothetical protein
MRKAAVFTVVNNEKIFLPIWLKYYSKYFDKEDIYILNHQTDSDNAMNISREFNVIPVKNPFYDYFWHTELTKSFYQFLLKSYEYVLYADVDEIIFPNPGSSKLNLRDYINFTTASVVGSIGYELVHDKVHEPAIDLTKEILCQRKWLQTSKIYSKTLLANQALDWEVGFHKIKNENNLSIRNDLILLHLHRMDFNLAWEKCQFTLQRNWDPECINQGAGYQNRINNISDFEKWFYTDFHDGSAYSPIQIPESFIGKV